MPEKIKKSQKIAGDLDTTPRKNGKLFTYSENKLLDQITTEIMDAWKNDLQMMRQYYLDAKDAQDEIKTSMRLATEELPKLNNLLKSCDFISSLPNTHEVLLDLKLAYINIAKTITGVNNRLTHIENHLAHIETEKSYAPKFTKKKESWWKGFIRRS